VVRAGRQRRVPADTVPGGFAGGPKTEDPGGQESVGRVQRHHGAARVLANGVRMADDPRDHVGTDRRRDGGPTVSRRARRARHRPVGPGRVRTTAGGRRRSGFAVAAAAI